MVDLKKGSIGKDVITLQKWLNSKGYTDNTGRKLLEDGKLGDLTVQAIIKFQKAKRLKQDGIFGQISQGKAYGIITTAATVVTPTVKPAADDGCKTSPRWLNDKDMVQDTNYFCGLNCSQQVLYELYGVRVKESEMAPIDGTTTDGTGHAGIIAGIKYEAKKNGFKEPSVEFVNFSDVGWAKVADMVADPNIGVFFHDLYRKKWGHYEYPMAVCLANKIVKIANSLSGGYIENRTFAEHEAYVSLISQPSLCIVRKV